MAEGMGRQESLPEHPPYCFMVYHAIRVLAEADGSTANSIAIHIDENFDSLPQSHFNLLPYYLEKLVKDGEILRPTSSDLSSGPFLYTLPRKPNPNPLVPRNISIRRNPNPLVPRRRILPEDNPNPNDPNPNLAVSEPVSNGEQRSRLLLRITREKLERGAKKRAEEKVEDNPNPNDPNPNLAVSEPVSNGEQRPRLLLRIPREKLERGAKKRAEEKVEDNPNPNLVVSEPVSNGEQRSRLLFRITREKLGRGGKKRAEEKVEDNPNPNDPNPNLAICVEW